VKSLELHKNTMLQLQGAFHRTGTKSKIFRSIIQSDVGCLEWPDFRGSDFSAFEEKSTSYYLILGNQNYRPL